MRPFFTCISSAIVLAMALPVHAQKKLPWGDPDISGTYNNSNESGIPMQRPAELAGKTLGQVTPTELGRLLERRHQQTERIPATIGGSADNHTSPRPPHREQKYHAKNM